MSAPVLDAQAESSLGRTLRYLVLRAAQRLHDNLSKAEGRSDSEKRDKLLSFAKETRSNFLRLLVLAHWAEAIPDHSQDCDMLIKNVVDKLSENESLFYRVPEKMMRIEADCVSLMAPNFDLLTAVDVLVTGNYFRIPYAPSLPPTAKLQEFDFDQDYESRLSRVIKTKLLASKMPPSLQRVEVEHTVAHLHLPTFLVTITLVPPTEKVDEELPMRIVDLVDDSKFGLKWKIVGFEPKLIPSEDQSICLRESIAFIRVMNDARTDCEDPLFEICALCRDATECIRFEAFKAQMSVHLRKQSFGAPSFVAAESNETSISLQFWGRVDNLNGQVVGGQKFTLTNNGEQLTFNHTPSLSPSTEAAIHNLLSQSHVSFDHLFVTVRRAAAISSLEKIYGRLLLSCPVLGAYLIPSFRTLDLQLQGTPVLRMEYKHLEMEFSVNLTNGKPYVHRSTFGDPETLAAWNTEIGESVSYPDASVRTVMSKALTLLLEEILVLHGFRRLNSKLYDFKHHQSHLPQRTPVLYEICFSEVSGLFDTTEQESKEVGEKYMIDLVLTPEFGLALDVLHVSEHPKGVSTKEEAKFLITFSENRSRARNHKSHLFKKARLENTTPDSMHWEPVLLRLMNELRSFVTYTALMRSWVEIPLPMKEISAGHLSVAGANQDYSDLHQMTIEIRNQGGWDVFIPTAMPFQITCFNDSNQHVTCKSNIIQLSYASPVLSERKKLLSNLKSINGVLRILRSLEKAFYGDYEQAIRIVSVDIDKLVVMLIDSERLVSISTQNGKPQLSYSPNACYSRLHQDPGFNLDDVGPWLSALSSYDKTIKTVEQLIMQSYIRRLLVIKPISAQNYRILIAPGVVLGSYATGRLTFSPYVDIKFSNSQYLSIEDLTLRHPLNPINKPATSHRPFLKAFFLEHFGLTFRSDNSFEAITHQKFLLIASSLLQFLVSNHEMNLFASYFIEPSRVPNFQLTSPSTETYAWRLDKITLKLFHSFTTNSLDLFLDVESPGWTHEEKEKYSHHLKKNCISNMEARSLWLFHIIMMPPNVQKCLLYILDHLSKLEPPIALLAAENHSMKPNFQYYSWNPGTLTLKNCVSLFYPSNPLDIYSFLLLQKQDQYYALCSVLSRFEGGIGGQPHDGRPKTSIFHRFDIQRKRGP
eukprot:TRINITY_DN7427_c0_g1_i2.p1 TRINITY_DN7427_c0_g1~~TRINITY_DN7427_c0_g1_i2.p1  ORF type:complete len:1152 (+),score=185.44 TRINITY_DN7427_c0_g1_i2:63-3518(+)